MRVGTRVVVLGLLLAAGARPGSGRTARSLFLPRLDADRLALEDARRATDFGPRAASRVGVVRRARIHAPRRLANASATVVEPDGSLRWAAEVRAPGAVSLRVHVARAELPSGTTVSVAAADEPAPSPASLDGSTLTSSWLPAVFSDAVRVELRVPREFAKSEVRFVVDEIAHRYVRESADETGPRAAKDVCYQDVACDPTWFADVSRAVAVIDFVKQGNEYLCSGALLADASASWTPWFLTAHHCISTQAAAQSAEFFFDYKSPACGTDAPPFASVPRTSGATLVATSENTDVSLLRITGALPPNRFFCPWTADAQSPGEPIVGVHHPGGTKMRISYGELVGENDGFHVVRWSDGVTAEGSSGSPLFNSQRQVIGQLYGGSSSCALPFGVDQYGRFDRSFRLLAAALGPREQTTLDAWDPGDDTPSGATVLVPEFASHVHGPHTLTPDDLVDWFAFDLTAGTQYRFFSLGSDDVAATLFSDEGTTSAATDDDSAGTGQFSIDFVATATARHWLRVETAPPGEAAQYRLAYVAVDALRRNAPARVDRLRAVVNGARVTVRWTDRARNETGYYVDRSEDGTNWTRVAELPRNSDRAVDVTSPGPHRYRVGAWNAAGVTWRRIAVKVIDSATRDAWDPIDDASGGATLLDGSGTLPVHTFSREDTADWFTFTLLAGTDYVFSSRSSLDLVAQIFSPADDLTPLAEDDDGGRRRNFELRFRPTATGTYLLRVAPYEPGVVGSYVLRFSSQP